MTINESVAEDLAAANVWELYNPNDVILNLANTHKLYRRVRDHYHPHHAFNWDAAHYNCWVYTEMNKALAVKYLYSS